MKKKRYKDSKLVKRNQLLKLCIQDNNSVIWYQGKLSVFVEHSNDFTESKELRQEALSLIDKKTFCIQSNRFGKDIESNTHKLSTGIIVCTTKLLINKARTPRERESSNSNQKYELSMIEVKLEMPTKFSLTGIILSALYDKIYELHQNFSIVKDNLVLKILSQSTNELVFKVKAIYAMHSPDAASRRSTKMVDITERGINQDSMQKKHIYLLVEDHNGHIAILPSALFTLM